jgi:hypothetical protein
MLSVYTTTATRLSTDPILGHIKYDINACVPHLCVPISNTELTNFCKIQHEHYTNGCQQKAVP